MGQLLRSVPGLSVVALVLLSCKAEAPEPEPKASASAGASACDQAALARLLEQHDAAEPDARPRIVASGLLEACPSLLSPGVADLVREAVEPRVDGSFARVGDDEEFDRARRLACPKLDELGTKLGDATASDRTKIVYDTCDYARYELLSPEQLGTSGGVHWITWTTHARLLEDGVPVALAKSTSRAVFTLEQALFAPVLISALPGQRFPKVPTANELPSGTVVSASPTEMVVFERPVATLDAGALSPSVVKNHVILPLFEFLEEEAEKNRMVAESQDQPWDARLILAFDDRIPFATVVDTMYTAGRAEFSSFAFVVENHYPVRRSLQLSPPRYADVLAPPPPSLKVFIYDDGFFVRLPGDEERREVAKLDAASREPVAWNYAALVELIQEFKRAHPDATQVIVSAENHIPLGVVLATYATLAGPKCDQVRRSDCLLPDLVLEAGAG